MIYGLEQRAYITCDEFKQGPPQNGIAGTLIE